MNNITWEEAQNNNYGIQTIGFKDDENFGRRIVGFNDIVVGDKVRWNKDNVVYTLVMTSRLGHIGLSTTGQLPYTVTVYPNEITKA